MFDTSDYTALISCKVNFVLIKSFPASPESPGFGDEPLLEVKVAIQKFCTVDLWMIVCNCQNLFALIFYAASETSVMLQVSQAYF